MFARFHKRADEPASLQLQISAVKADHSSILATATRPRASKGSFQQRQKTFTPPSIVTAVTFWPNTSSPSLIEQVPKAVKSKHIPIDTSFYTQLENSGYTSPETQFGRRPSLPILWRAQHDFEASSRTPPIIRHVPIVIPFFAQPFAQNSISGLRAHTGVGSPRSRSRREGCLFSSAIADLKESPQTLQEPEAERDNPANDIVAKMNDTQANLSVPQSGKDDLAAVPKSTTAAAAANTPSGLSPAVNQHVGGAGPTNLSGLVCNVHRTTGKEPHPLVGATTTILGDKLYVFGGRVLSRSRPQLTNDLYELDLIRRHWTRLETIGDVPPPRYFHSVCALGDKKLVCYGGMSPTSHSANQSAINASSSQQHSDPQPEVVVMSDIHIYDVTTRAWTLIPTADTPQGRYAHCATILPSSAVFASASAPLSAIHHNPSSSNPHSGTLGVKLDGTGGAEMVIVGGQDSSNHYIEQISVFNLRSLKWTATNSLGRSCGAYRSVVAPLIGMSVSSIGKGLATDPETQQNLDEKEMDSGSPMLIYSNYNFLDVKLELQIRHADGRLSERSMSGTVSPPGLRFPNGGIVDNHFVVSGTYLTSSKQEYALWALDLRTLTWGRIDAGGTIFGQGSWNRGVLWNRRNTFVILGHRRRSLADDYNHRRINFSHLCMVELEAFGLYDNPRTIAPTSGYVSISSPSIQASLQPALANLAGGGRPYSAAAEQLGQAALGIKELSDMDLVAMGGERIPVNSHLLSRRWGPYFNQLLMASTSSHDSISDAVALRLQMKSQTSRNSSITITPSLKGSSYSTATTLTANSGMVSTGQGLSPNSSQVKPLGYSFDSPDPASLPPARRPRALYLPHTPQTLRLLLHYLYTSTLPPITSPLCTPQILCSLLQLARPYQIDGLLEATVERLHEVLDGRNAAAVFNASAMAAGGGRGLGYPSSPAINIQEHIENKSNGVKDDDSKTEKLERALSIKKAGLRINTSLGDKDHEGSGPSRPRRVHGHEKSDSVSSASTATSASTSTSFSYTESDLADDAGEPGSNRDSREREAWSGDVSSVIGLQKRGLRGLMEGRRLRERGNTGPTSATATASAGALGRPAGGAGLGIA